MATDHIRYDVLARDALRGVLRRVLTDAAEHGLPGEHHFFITFLSTAEGVARQHVVSDMIGRHYQSCRAQMLPRKSAAMPVVRLAHCRHATPPAA